MPEPAPIDIPDGVVLCRWGDVPDVGWEIADVVSMFDPDNEWVRPIHRSKREGPDDVVLARRIPVTVEVPLDVAHRAKDRAEGGGYDIYGRPDANRAREARHDIRVLSDAIADAEEDQ